MRATEKTSKKNIANKIFVIFQNELGFFFEKKKKNLSPEIDRFFSEIGNNLMHALGRKNTCFFLVMRGLNLMRALI